MSIRAGQVYRLIQKFFIDPAGDRVARSPELKSQTVPCLDHLAYTDVLYPFIRDLFRIADKDVELEKARTGIDDVVLAAGHFDDIVDDIFAIPCPDKVKGQIAVVEQRHQKHHRKSTDAHQKDGADRWDQRSIPDIDNEIRKASRHGDDRIGDTAREAQEGFKADQDAGRHADDHQIDRKQRR